MPRLLFEKTGNAVWMSHLDLMRLFQRAFKRAGMSLTHTQGFNPRPSVSIALPLSVGVSSHCELLDFELDGSDVSPEELCQRLNTALVDGVRVLNVYDGSDKIKHISYLDCEVSFQYDSAVPSNAIASLTELFARNTLLVEKKGKNGTLEQDIIPMIRSLHPEQTDDHTVTLSARICCQNPTLNPAQLTAAVEGYLPWLKPDHVTYIRKEIYNKEEIIFR